MMRMPLTATREYITETRQLFHCSCKIKIPLVYGQGLIDRCFQLMEEIDFRYNSYQEGSDFYRINQASGKWTTVDNTTIDILKKLIKVSQITEGSYDITSMPLIRQWGFYRSDAPQEPSPEEIYRALKHVGYQKIAIDGNRVRISHGQELITGSFVKAFAVDKVINELRLQGVDDAIVNAGGSTIFALANKEHPAWTINIPDPNKAHGLTVKKLLSNQCFSLSGSVNNYIELNGKRYGHILNASTGYPATTIQVGVCAQEAFWSDVISTALFTIAPEHFDRTLKEMKNAFKFEHFIVRPTNTDHQ